MTDRMQRQSQIERLLDEIRDGVNELRLRKTYGIRAAALDERKRQLARARQQLAAIVSG